MIDFQEFTVIHDGFLSFQLTRLVTFDSPFQHMNEKGRLYAVGQARVNQKIKIVDPWLEERIMM